MPIAGTPSGWLPVKPDGTLGPRRGALVDLHGNLFAAGPGGVYVFDAAGSLLIIATNAALYRVRLSTRGAGLN
jgi:hypothetical protein